jgi:eukaryotic-like serine/threonine-protein kinase
VPNLVGKNLNDARNQIAQLGLVLVEPTRKESDKPRDEVIGQSPAAGGGVEKGAQIRLEVSEGPPLVTVPRVVDLPCQQAKQVLESQGFPVTVQFNPNAVTRFQNPNENAQVAPGTQITIGCF